MKRPSVNMPKRPRSTAGAVARSRKEAAIQLVRLEFDTSRLEMAIEQAETRARTHRSELQSLHARRRALINTLNT